MRNMELTISEAAKFVGRSRSSVLRAVSSGKLSSQSGADGRARVNASELARIFPERQPKRGQAPRQAVEQQDAAFLELERKVAELQEQLARLQKNFDEMESRLAATQEDQRSLQHRFTALAARELAEEPAGVSEVHALRGRLEEVEKVLRAMLERAPEVASVGRTSRRQEVPVEAASTPPAAVASPGTTTPTPGIKVVMPQRSTKGILGKLIGR